jgi:hypothetical protein
MTKTLAIKAAAFSALGFGLVSGLVGMAGASSLSTEGPDSPIRVHARNNQTWTNSNRVGVHNDNWQSAYSGDAKVKHNTTGGDATSGNASNDNMFDAAITLSNSSGGGGGGGGGADLSTTGPDSPIHVRASNTTTVTNDNNVWVSNDSSQHASSGDATVSHNTTGGDATSGDASNTNSSSVTIDISN